MKNDKLLYLSEQIISVMENDEYKPMKFNDFAFIFDMHSKNQKNLLSNSLNYLIKEKKIKYINNRYSPTCSNIYEGVFEKGRGLFGFVNVEGLDEDIFVVGSESMDAFSGDKVKVEVIKEKEGDRKREGRIVEITEKVKRQTVGTFYKEKTFGFVVSDNPNFTNDIYIPKAGIKYAKNKDKVVVEITDFPKDKKNWVGKITKVLGRKDENGVDIEALIYEYDVPYEFSHLALKEADELEFDSFDKFKGKRKDLTDVNIFTIDGPTAKDLDDAVSIVKKENEYVLSVHIADVSNYVKRNSEIDKDAYERGTSIYFADRVIPMLPKTLCENLCSLNPKEEKKAFSVDMRINKEGKLLDYNFYKSIIKSKAKFVYDEVNELFDGSKDLREEYYTYEEDLNTMKELYELLRQRRYVEGNLDFDVDENFITVENGVVTDVSLRERGIAERIIEQFMLVANTSACEFFSSMGLNGIYRVHEEPDKEKLSGFIKFANALGYKLRLHDGHYSKELEEFLKTIEGDKNEQLFKTVLLRCMKKAVYTTENKGHFALAIENYTHFTSPIRRYPDLMVHRILSNILLGNIDLNNLEKEREKMEKKANHLSKMERRSEEMERESDKIFICQYMENFIDEEYEGRVSGFSSKGMYVKLNNSIEGVIYFTNLNDDYYIYDEEHYSLVGRDFGRRFTMGDKINIKVISVSKLKREVEFCII
ncbi:ribonuclease R [Anaerofustis stercorihominis DSM 17244]|uniref:Ribonuclease R n=2 Tax=Anaerofustis stercorihominis TaxID=214853 RepID=B1C6T0_9FIRM|nr:ribonuclease R [Anaerofustis stercorihominis]EDS72717.1 ribonuclease R [Anaerofustis stercorihominis DSM 17244]